MWLVWVRRALLALSLIFASSLVYVLLTNTDSGSSPHLPSPNSLPDGDAGMEGFTFLHSQNDRVKWQVRADRAQLFESDHRAVLDNVEVSLFGEQGREIRLVGDEGTIDTEKRDFVVANRDRLLAIELDGGYTIYTNHLTWLDDQQELRTQDLVTIVGHGMDVKGRGLVGNLDSEEFHIQHDVEVHITP